MKTEEPGIYEALDEMTHLFALIQAAGSRLANDTHGTSYDRAQEMNVLLRMARGKLREVEEEMFGAPPRGVERRSVLRRRVSDT